MQAGIGEAFRRVDEERTTRLVRRSARYSMNTWHRLGRSRIDRRTMLRASARAGVGAAGLALVGCGDDDIEDSGDGRRDDEANVVEQPSEPRSGGTARTVNPFDLLSFDQFTTFGLQAMFHGHFMYPKLTAYGTGPDVATNETVAELWLAESLEQPDDTTYVFHIDENAKWEDREPVNGRPVSSDDVLYTYGDPYQSYPNRGLLLPHLNRIDAIGPKIVSFELLRPVQPFLIYVGHQAGPYIHPFEFEDYEGKLSRPVSAASMRMVSYDVGSKVIYERNPDYWRSPKPHIDRLEVVFLSDPSSLVAAFRSGELDITSGLPIQPIPAPDVAELMAEFPDGTWSQVPDLAVWAVTVDLGLAPFNDNRVRRAISLSLDRDAMLSLVGGVEHGGWQSALPPLAPWWRDAKGDPELRPFFERNLKVARELITAAGFGDGTAEITMNTAAFTPNKLEEAQLIQANLAEIDISVSLNVQDLPEYASTTFIGESVGRMGHTGFGLFSDPDEILSSTYVPEGPRSGIINGEEMAKDGRLGELIAAQRGENNPARRKVLIDDLQLHLAEAMYAIPLVSGPVTFFAQPDLKNVHHLQTMAMAPAFEEFWIEES